MSVTPWELTCVAMPENFLKRDLAGKLDGLQVFLTMKQKIGSWYIYLKMIETNILESRGYIHLSISSVDKSRRFVSANQRKAFALILN